ncbi:MAG: FHA domain-containing protein, partial [Myxococcales bacterium]|nr:FHA domain-containing protein [Myxococcales bacterium]
PEEGGFVVCDLNSVNGTFVNDVQVRRRKLEPDDVVRIGSFTFRFESEGDPDITHKVTRPEFAEVLTVAGAEPPAQIIGSLDATSASGPHLTIGLNELEDAYRKLRTLYSFTQAIATTLDTGDLLERILKNLLNVFPAAQSVAVFLRDSLGAMVPRMVLPQRQEGVGSGLLTLPAQFHGEVVSKGRAILSAPVAGGMSMHSPMIFNESTQGVLHVRSNDRSTRFSQDDLDLLTGMAAQAAMAVQNARMHQESIKQQRLQQDLLLAEQIQKSFLPRQLPLVEGIEFITEYRPAYSVGGDFYDVFWLHDERIGLFIGDVSGKGVSAALLMARISSDLRVAAMAESEPARALAKVNRQVLERRQHDIFVTGIYLTLDTRTREFVMANAGHPPPFIRRQAGLLERIDGGTATAIGIDENAEYEQVRVRLGAGDSLVLCTDGVLEATDARGEQFGWARIEKSLSAENARAPELAERLLADVRKHVGEAAQNDDLTLIVCGVADEKSKVRTGRRDAPTMNMGRPTIRSRE